MEGCHLGNICVDMKVLVADHVAVLGLDHYDGFFEPDEKKLYNFNCKLRTS